MSILRRSLAIIAPISVSVFPFASFAFDTEPNNSCSAAEAVSATVYSGTGEISTSDTQDWFSLDSGSLGSFR